MITVEQRFVMSAHDAITFYIQGSEVTGGRLTAGELAGSFGEWAAALEATANGIRTAPRPVAWVVTRTEIGSFASVITPDAQTDAERADARETSRLVILAMNQGAQGVDVGTILPAKGATHMAQFLRLVKQHQFPLVSATTDELSARITGIDLPPDPHLVSYRALSSIEGTLVSVSYAGAKPACNVRLRLTDKIVTCSFQLGLASTVDAALRRRVAVRGMVTYRIDGEPTTVADVSEIYVFPHADDLPGVDDVAGIIPDLTGGLPSGEWLRRRRA